IGRLTLQSRLERGQGGFFPLVQGIHDLFDGGRGFITRASAHDAGNHQQAHHARHADQVSHQIFLTTFLRVRSADHYSSVSSEHSDGRKATVLDHQSYDRMGAVMRNCARKSPISAPRAAGSRGHSMTTRTTTSPTLEHALP